MAFIENNKNGRSYMAGYFLASNENVTRVTKNFKSDGDSGSYTVSNGAKGTKYVKMGEVYKENGETAIGIVYEDVDVSNGEAAGSVVISGTVYKDRLVNGEDASTINGITLIDKSPIVTRPKEFKPTGGDV